MGVIGGFTQLIDSGRRLTLRRAVLIAMRSLGCVLLFAQREEVMDGSAEVSAQPVEEVARAGGRSAQRVERIVRPDERSASPVY